MILNNPNNFSETLNFFIFFENDLIFDYIYTELYDLIIVKNSKNPND